MSKLIEDVQVWSHKGSGNVWHGKMDDGGNSWEVCMSTPGDAEAKLDGWFSVNELREIANYIENAKAKAS